MIKTRGKCEEGRGDMAGKKRYMSYTKVCKAERDRKMVALFYEGKRRLKQQKDA